MGKRWFNFDNTKDKGLKELLSKLPFNQINVETLAATKTLVIADKLNQHLNPNLVDRIIILPSTDVESGDQFKIKNTGIVSDAAKLIVKQVATIIDNIFSGNTKAFIYDGTNWTSNDGSAGSNDDYAQNTAFGKSAGAYNKSNAYGYNSEATEENAFAIGNNAIANRHGEHATVVDSSQLEKRIANSWIGETGDANWTEIFLNGSSKQFLIVADSGISFDILFIAKTCVGVSPDVARYKIHGVIERVTTGTPAIPWSLVTTDYESDATWDVRVAVDVGTNALKVEVKGGALKIVFWHAVLQLSPELICTP